MPSPVVKATIQSVVICLCSCLIALYLTPERPPHVLSLLLFSALSTPPNFWWQKALEARFPGFIVNKVKVDDGGEGVEVEKKLNVRNTCIKVFLDQTIAALINTVAYIGGTRLLRGVPIGICWDAVKEVSARSRSRNMSRALTGETLANLAYHGGRLQTMAGSQCGATCVSPS